MAIPELLDTSLRLTDAIYYGQNSAGGASVPSTRQINTTAPLTGGGDLSADRTLALTTSPVGQVPVGVTRALITTQPLRIAGSGSADLSADRTLTLTTSPAADTTVVGTARQLLATSPVRIAGTGVADLSADRTISVLPFTGAVDGIVTHNPSGVQGKFLKDDNTWATSAVAGVSDITANAPLTASSSTGSVTLDVDVVSLSENGVAPAIGTATGTKCLTDTNPPTWATPGLGGYVRLQGSTPGTADVGSAHIDGTLITQDNVVAGNSALLGGGFVGAIESVNNASTNYVLRGRSAATSFGPFVRLERSRGTVSAPTVTQNNDELGGLFALGYNSGGGFSGSITSGMHIKADGNATASEQPTYLDLIAGSVGSNTYGRLSSAGLLIKPGAVSSSDRATSTLEVEGSFGLDLVSKTSNFTAGTDVFYNVDATGGDITITLPSAVGVDNRIYGFQRVDSTANRVVFSGSINGVAGFDMDQTESIIIQSDGSNWYRKTFRSHAPYTRMNVNTSTAVSGTTTKTSFSQTVTLDRHQRSLSGETFLTAQFFAAGQYSTHGSGTNNITFYLRDNTPQDVLESRTLTLTNSLSNEIWTFRASVLLNTPSNIRIIEGEVIFYDSTGDKRSVMLESVPVYTAANVYTLSCGVQWSNTNAGNSIDQRRLTMNTFEGYMSF